MRFILTSLMSLALAVSCQNTDQAAELYGAGVFTNNLGSFEGCIDGEAIDRQSVKVIYNIPDEATEFKIFRDGQLISTLYKDRAGSSGEILDQNLREGGEYKYTCQAKIRGVFKRGSGEINLKPINTYAPVFEGIKTAELKTSSSVGVEWEPATENGPIARYYLVYYSAGRQVNFKSTPVKVEGKLSVIIEKLGDEIPYSFAVRACTINDICDKNIVSKTIETPDTGAPLTQGISSLIPKSGKTLEVIAPWSHEQGGVYKRKVIIVRSSQGESDEDAIKRVKACSVDAQTDGCQNIAFAFTDGIVSSSLEFPVEENVTYFIRLVDEDKPKSTVAKKDHVEIKKFQTADLTPPSFSGILELTQPDVSKNTLRATFQAASDAEAVHVYKVTGSITDTLEDPCQQSGAGERIPRSAWGGEVSMNYIEFESNERSQVRVCLKASDASGNISIAKGYKTIKTKDRSAPLFDGLGRIRYLVDESTGKGTIRFSWSEAYAFQNDVDRYFLSIDVVNGSNTRRYEYSYSSDILSVGIDTEAMQLDDYETIYAAVNVCDRSLTEGVNAIPSKNNCSVYSINQASSKEGLQKLALGIIKPPVKFDGINGLESTEHGTLTVRWGRYNFGQDFPNTWAGFKVYSIKKDGSKTLLKTIPCPSIGEDSQGRAIYNCAGIQSTTISNLSPYQERRVYVKAYNSQGDSQDIREENALVARVKDALAPVIQGNISKVVAGSNLTLSWPLAEDTQFAWQDFAETLSTKITYVIKRDGAVLATQEAATIIIDLRKLPTGMRNFQVCPKDQAGNVSTNCLSVDYEIRDILPPEVKIAKAKRISAEAGLEIQLSLKDETTNSSTLCNDLAVADSGSSITKVFNSTSNLCVISGINGDVNTNLEKAVKITVFDQARNSTIVTTTVKINRQYAITSARWGDWDSTDATKRYALVIRGSSILANSEVFNSSNVKLNCDQPDTFKIICFASSTSGNTQLTIKSGASSASLSASTTFSNCSSASSTDVSGTLTIPICNANDWKYFLNVDTTIAGNTKTNIQRLTEKTPKIVIDFRNNVMLGDVTPMLLPQSSTYKNNKLIIAGNGYMLNANFIPYVTTNSISNYYYFGLTSEIPYNLDVTFQDLGIYQPKMNFSMVQSPSISFYNSIYAGTLTAIIRKLSNAGMTLKTNFTVDNVWVDSFQANGSVFSDYHGVKNVGGIFGLQSGIDSTGSKDTLTVLKNIQVTRLNVLLTDTSGGTNGSQCDPAFTNNPNACGSQFTSCGIGCGQDIFFASNISVSGKMINNTMGSTYGAFSSIIMAYSASVSNISTTLELKGRRVSGLSNAIHSASSTGSFTISNLSFNNTMTIDTVYSTSDSYAIATGLTGDINLKSPLILENIRLNNSISSRFGAMYGVFKSTGGTSDSTGASICKPTSPITLPSLTLKNIDLNSTYSWASTTNYITSSLGRVDNVTPVIVQDSNFEDQLPSNTASLNYASIFNPYTCTSPLVTMDSSYWGSLGVGSWDAKAPMTLDQIKAPTSIITDSNGTIAASTSWNDLNSTVWTDSLFTKPALKSTLQREGLISVE